MQNINKETGMSNHSGIETWGKNRRELRGRRSKTDLIGEIGDKFHKRVVDLQALTLKDLRTILTSEPKKRISIPTGRLKAPYVNELTKSFPKVMDFNKLSVTGLVSLLEAIK